MKTIPDLNSFDKETQKNIKDWLESGIDEKTKEDIVQLIQSKPEECINAFYKKLTFGTGGLRGIMGPGSNRMNRYTVRMATFALALYLKNFFSKNSEIKVVIGYDNRKNSRDFAEEAAKTLAAAQIKALLLENLRPTPFVSFATRELSCQSGIMITASHNPKDYNGFKVYWDDGGQVLPPHDVAIIEIFNTLKDPSQIPIIKDLKDPFIDIIGDSLDQVYFDKVSTLQGMKRENHLFGNQLHVIYSSLHGTGVTMVPPLLKDWGFEKVSLVQKQCIPDGNFPTLKLPNPEEKEALTLGIELLKQEKADLFIATDPDADRVGVALLDKEGNEWLLSGNDIACILLEHVLSQLQKDSLMPPLGVAIKSVVTTELYRKIADSFEVECQNVLPGFKYIAEKIRNFEHDGSQREFIFGAEESYGYLRGTFSRDKDAVLTSALLCEAALKFKMRGLNLKDGLLELFRQFGVFLEMPYTLQFHEGKEGSDKIQNILQKLKQNPPTSLADIPIISFADYEKQIRISSASDKKELLDLPKTSMFELTLEGGSQIFIRPSGTEPKLKTYLMIQKPISQDVEASFEEAKNMGERLKKALGDYFEV